MAHAMAYSRQGANRTGSAFPAKSPLEYKFWPHVARVTP
jgi:hypothetical protein